MKEEKTKTDYCKGISLNEQQQRLSCQTKTIIKPKSTNCPDCGNAIQTFPIERKSEKVKNK